MDLDFATSYTTESLLFKQKFLNEIRVTFKSGGFTCAFNERELIEFHNYLEMSFPFDAEGKNGSKELCVLVGSWRKMKIKKK